MTKCIHTFATGKMEAPLSNASLSLGEHKLDYHMPRGIKVMALFWSGLPWDFRGKLTSDKTVNIFLKPSKSVPF